MRMLYNMDDELLWGFKSKQKRHLTSGTLTIFKRSLNKSSVLAETHIHLGQRMAYPKKLILFHYMPTI